MNKISPVFISLVLFDCGGVGHNYEYLKAISEATQKIGWKHYAALPINFNEQDLKSDWSACLAGCRKLNNRKENKLIKILRLILISCELAKSIHQYLNKTLSVVNNCSPTIIFIDSFKPSELLAFVISLFFLRSHKLTVWLLYRHDDYQKKLIGNFYKFMNMLIEKKITKNKFILLTDSEKLQGSLSSYFKYQFFVVPIPHTPTVEYSKNIEITNNRDDLSIFAWWCGNPNPEKGLEVIQKLVNSSNLFAKNLHLFISKEAYLPEIKNNIQITYLPAYLTRQEYLQQLNEIDILLLPYDSKIYKERTSGVFVEGICAGKVPFVTQDTWMATELIRHDLSELIIDWNEDNIIESILKLARNNNIKNKIVQMHDRYLKIHSVSSYAECIQKIYNL
jgi:hypothetical protein